MVRITHDQTRVARKPDGRNSYLLALSITVTPASPQPSFPRKRESTAAGAPPLNSCSSNSSRFAEDQAVAIFGPLERLQDHVVCFYGEVRVLLWQRPFVVRLHTR